MQAAELVFGVAAGRQDYLMDTFFRLFALMLELVAVCNWLQKVGSFGVEPHMGPPLCAVLTKLAASSFTDVSVML